MSLSEQTESANAYAASNDEFAALILDRRGMILECNRAAEVLFGYPARELIWRHISLLLPQLEEGMLASEGRVNPKLKFMCHCGQLFLVLDRQCKTFFSELHLVELSSPGSFTVRAILCPVNP